MKTVVSWIFPFVVAIFLTTSVLPARPAKASDCPSPVAVVTAGETMYIDSAAGWSGEVLAIQSGSEGLSVHVESVSDSDQPVWIERIFCDSPTAKPWPSGLMAPSPETTHFLRVGTLTAPPQESESPIRISTLGLPACSYNGLKDGDPGDETEEEDGQIILLTGSEGPCWSLVSANLAPQSSSASTKDGGPGDETEEEDGQIILFESTDSEGPCGFAEPWNELPPCARSLPIGGSFHGRLDNRSADLSAGGGSHDLDLIVFEAPLIQGLSLEIEGLPEGATVRLSNDRDQILLDGAGGDFGDHSPRSMRLDPALYTLQIAGYGGEYTVHLKSAALPGVGTP